MWVMFYEQTMAQGFRMDDRVLECGLRDYVATTSPCEKLVSPLPAQGLALVLSFADLERNSESLVYRPHAGTLVPYHCK